MARGRGCGNITKVQGCGDLAVGTWLWGLDCGDMTVGAMKHDVIHSCIIFSNMILNHDSESSFFLFLISEFQFASEIFWEFDSTTGKLQWLERSYDIQWDVPRLIRSLHGSPGAMYGTAQW